MGWLRVEMRDASLIERYTPVLRRWWWVIVIVFVLGLAVTWLTLPEAPRELTAEEIADPDVLFRATHILFRNDESPSAVSFDLVLLLGQQGELTSRVVDRLDGAIDSADVEAIQLEADANIGTLSITAVQSLPDVAVELTEVYGVELNRLLGERSSISVQADIERQRQQVEALELRIEDVEAELAPLPEGSLERRLLEAELEELLARYGREQSALRDLEVREADVEPAFSTLQAPVAVPADADRVPTLALPQSPMARFALFGFLSLLIGLASVIGVDRFDTRIRTRADAEDAFGLPVIAELPWRSHRERNAAELPVVTEADGPTAEAFRSLRLSVLLSPKWQLVGEAPAESGSIGSVAPLPTDTETRTLVVSSPDSGDGKSTVVANLAASFVESGKQVVVVDCDFRRPAVGPMLGAEAGPGLRRLKHLRNENLHDLCVGTRVDGVRLVPAGEPGVAPAWFLTGSAELVRRARGLADVVLFDTGPLSLTNEAMTLVPAVDAAIIVVRANKVTWPTARECIRRLASVRAKVAGLVFVGGDTPRRYEYYQPLEQPASRDTGLISAKTPFKPTEDPEVSGS